RLTTSRLSRAPVLRIADDGRRWSLWSAGCAARYPETAGPSRSLATASATLGHGPAIPRLIRTFTTTAARRPSLAAPWFRAMIARWPRPPPAGGPMYRTEGLLRRHLGVRYPAGQGRMVLRTELDWDDDVEALSVSDDGETSTFALEAQKPFLYF